MKREGKDGDRVPQNTEQHKETKIVKALTRERMYSSSYFTNKAGWIFVSSRKGTTYVIYSVTGYTFELASGI